MSKTAEAGVEGPSVDPLPHPPRPDLVERTWGRSNDYLAT